MPALSAATKVARARARRATAHKAAEKRSFTRARAAKKAKVRAKKAKARAKRQPATRTKKRR